MLLWSCCRGADSCDHPMPTDMHVIAHSFEGLRLYFISHACCIYAWGQSRSLSWCAYAFSSVVMHTHTSSGFRIDPSINTACMANEVNEVQAEPVIVVCCHSDTDMWPSSTTWVHWACLIWLGPGCIAARRYVLHPRHSSPPGQCRHVQCTSIFAAM